MNYANITTRLHQIRRATRAISERAGNGDSINARQALEAIKLHVQALEAELGNPEKSDTSPLSA